MRPWRDEIRLGVGHTTFSSPIGKPFVNRGIADTAPIPDELDSLAKILGSRPDRSDRILISNGLFTSQVPDVLKDLLKENGLEDQVAIDFKDDLFASDDPIKLTDFFSNDPKSGAILRIESTPEKDGSFLNHFVLRLGSNAEKNEMILIDPFHPNAPILAKVEDLTQQGKGFAIHFPVGSDLGKYNLTIHGVVKMVLK